MDDFKEMKEIERQFGSLNLNPDEELAKRRKEQSICHEDKNIGEALWGLISD